MICVFKCVNCGDHMVYSIEKRALVCSTCGSECDIEYYDMENMTWDGRQIMSEGVEGAECPVCGAKVTKMEGSAKMACSFCGSELAAFGLKEDELSPEKIIPCRLSKEDAKTKLLGWWLKHPTMPKYDEKKLKIKIQDIYVPVWLYNADIMTRLAADILIYRGGEADYVNDMERIDKMYVSKFKHVPFDSSVHIEDELFYDIEPFNYSEMEDFNPSYLSGHMAEHYHMEPEYVLPRAVGRLKEFALKQAVDFLDSTIGASEIVDIPEKEIDITPTEVIYALVPVWVCSYVYQGKRRNVFVNGQTGKVAGDVIFAGNTFKHDIIFYGVCAAVFNAAIAFLIVTFMSIYGFGYAFCGFLGQLLPLVIALKEGISTKEGKGKIKGVNEEVQLRQGMKVSAVGSGLSLLICGISVILFAIFLYPSAIFGIHGDIVGIIVLVSVITLAVTGLMTYFFAQKLYRYTMFAKKTEYYDYAPKANFDEVRIWNE